MDVTELINQFGFPISVAIACGWMVYKMYSNMIKENANRENKLFEMISKFNDSLDKFSNVLDGYEMRLGNIEKSVNDIKDIVNK